WRRLLACCWRWASWWCGGSPPRTESRRAVRLARRPVGWARSPPQNSWAQRCYQQPEPPQPLTRGVIAMDTVSFRPSLAAVPAHVLVFFLPPLRAHAYRRFFPGRPDREDLVAEAIGHGWAMVYRAWKRGRDLTGCPGIVAKRAVLRAAAGERLAGNGYTRCRT